MATTGNPSSTGQGQGFAQVFRPTRTADYYVAQKEQEKADAKLDAERQRAAIDELKGRFDEVLKSDIFYTRDKDAFAAEWNKLRGQFDGKWEQVYRGDTPEARAYNDAILNLYNLAGQSREAKKYATEKWNDMEENPDLYEQEDWNNMAQFMSSPMNFDQPTILKGSKYDLEKGFQENVYKPLNDQARGRTKSGTYEKDGQKISYTGYSSTEDERKNQLAQWWNNPEVQRKFIKQYKDEIVERGIEDNPYQLFQEMYYPRTEINVRDFDKTTIPGTGKDKAFNAGNIQTNVTYKQGNYETTANVYQTDKVTSNSAFTNNVRAVTSSGASYPLDRVEVRDVSYSSPAIVQVDSKGNILPKGKQGTPKIMVAGDIQVGDEWITIYRPFDEVKEDFSNAGYDVDEIENGLYSTVQSGGGGGNTVKVGQVVDGYRYIGGDPKSESSWKKI